MEMDPNSTAAITQTQSGPLRLKVPSTINLVQESRASKPSRVYSGFLQLLNGANHLVTFKVMNIGADEVTVKPTEGLVNPLDYVKIHASVKNNSLSVCGVQSGRIAIVIFATTCEVDDFAAANLSSFWNKIIKDGSKAFVDVFVIKDFYFTDRRGLTQSVSYDADGNETSGSSSRLDDQQPFFTADSCSSSVCDNGSDSEGSGDSSQWKKKQFQNIIREMKQVSKTIKRRNKVNHRRGIFSVFLMIIIIFFSIQRFFNIMELNILAWSQLQK